MVICISVLQKEQSKHFACYFIALFFILYGCILFAVIVDGRSHNLSELLCMHISLPVHWYSIMLIY